MSKDRRGGNEAPRGPRIEDFLDAPPTRLGDWRWLWAGDHPLPLRSHRRFWGRLIVLGKRLLRPLVRAPQSDLWERQRIFNLVLLDHFENLERRIGQVAAEAVSDAMRHNDALFALVDQKLDRYRREVRQLMAALQDAASNPEAGLGAELDHAERELAYGELERRFRGEPDEIRERVRFFLPWLDRLPTEGPLVDLGCGRGEALAVLAGAGLRAVGVDSSSEMVARCREQGLEAVEQDVEVYLRSLARDSVAGILCLHVVEHLPPASVQRLIRLARRALRPGGVLILETPNPLSVVVAARSFWLDPTHVRPLHPSTLRLWLEEEGFVRIEQRWLSPFKAAERLPEVDVSSLADGAPELADGINRLRDRLDDLLFGYQDVALIATRPLPPASSR